MRHNRQNREQVTAILWTPDSDEGWKIPQESIQQLRTWSQEEGKTKETLDWYDLGGLQRIVYDTTGVHMHGEGQESVDSYHRWEADACDSIAWAIKKKEEEEE